MGAIYSCDYTHLCSFPTLYVRQSELDNQKEVAAAVWAVRNAGCKGWGMANRVHVSEHE